VTFVIRKTSSAQRNSVIQTVIDELLFVFMAEVPIAFHECHTCHT